MHGFHFEMHKTADFHSNLTEGYEGRPMKCVHFKWNMHIAKDHSRRGNSLVRGFLKIPLLEPKAILTKFPEKIVWKFYYKS